MLLTAKYRQLDYKKPKKILKVLKFLVLKGDIHIMLLFTVLFWVTTRIGLNAFLLYFLKNSKQCPVLMNTQSPLIGQLTHVWPNITNYNKTAALNQFSHAKLATGYKLCKYLTWWHSVTPQSHRNKGGTPEEVLQRQSSVGKRNFHWSRQQAFWLSRSLPCTRTYRR